MDDDHQSPGTIGWAVAMLKAGHKIRRRKWVGMYLVYNKSRILQVVGGDSDPFTCLQGDLLATDWEEIT